jgi:cell division protein FtsB
MIAKLRHLIYVLRHDYFTRENSLLIVIFIIFALWVGSSVTAMSRNWQQQRNLDAAKSQLTKLQAEVATLGYEQQYYQSTEYQELAAREKQNKMLPGETMLRLPPNTADAIAKYAAADTQAVPRLSNPEQWLKFLFP